VSRGTWELDRERLTFRLRDFHPLWLPIQWYSARLIFCNSLVPSWQHLIEPRYPAFTTPTSFNMNAVWAVPLSLAATEGIAVAFFSSRY
jgi:hypothetical protein